MHRTLGGNTRVRVKDRVLQKKKQELLGETPWGSCEGQSLANALVHWEDMSILENMWLEAQVILFFLGVRVKGRVLLYNCTRCSLIHLCLT